MPIHYRCPACDQLLSISTRKAGHEVPCPQCGGLTIVPQPDENSGLPVQSSPAFSDSTQPPAEELAAPASRIADSDEQPAEALSHPPERLFEDPLVGPRERSAEARHHEVDTLATVDKDEEAGGFQVRRANPSLGDLDLTSMVDVTFLLLIFFMVTASFSLQKTIEVPPPKQDEKGAAQSLTIEDLQANTIFVKIDERNAIFIDDAPAGNPQELADVLTKTRLTTLRTELAIDAHLEALHETVVLVIDAATAAGMQKIRIVSRSGGSD